MAEYVDLPIETEPIELADEAFAYLAARVPGWEPADGNLETWILEAAAQIAGEVRDVASQVPVAVFRYFGAQVAGLPPINPAFATGEATITVTHDDGETIVAGTELMLRTATGERVAFATTEDAIIEAGDTSITAIGIVAIEAGAIANGLSGGAEPVDALDVLDSIVVPAATSGGADGETDDEYLARLVEELRLVTPRPILANDFAVLARRVDGVGRAVALDNFDPADPSTPADRMVTVAVTDETGQVVAAEVKTAVGEYLESFRETNFVVNVVDPTVTAVTIDVEIVVQPGYDEATVTASVEDSIAAYADPARWGTPSYGDQELWINETVVRYLKVAQVAGDAPGVLYVSDLQLDAGTTDVTLDGDVSLPDATINVTVAP